MCRITVHLKSVFGGRTYEQAMKYLQGMKKLEGFSCWPILGASFMIGLLCNASDKKEQYHWEENNTHKKAPPETQAGLFVELTKGLKLANNFHWLGFNTQVFRWWFKRSQVNTFNGFFVLFQSWEATQNSRKNNHWGGAQ